ncbi:MAG TPA: PEP-CTERM sorting domain-containing protein [Verrucomicrobiae bacterium]|nr:PEP-CTERM sorting domain-containing protein [Verrucomicrobiae bacterium]
MKHKAFTKQLAAMLAIVVGLALASSTQAQFVTGQPTLNNINPNGTFPSGAWTTANMADTATGLQITAPGGPGTFSTLYYPLPAPQVTPLNTQDNAVIFTWTWNSGNAVGGVNVLFALDDNNGGVDYYDAIVPAYSLTPVPGTTYSITLPLQQPNQANVAAGFPIGGLNFQIDPANVSGNYTMTMNSIQLIPEPATLSLVGLGLLGLLGLRRRRTS